MVVEDNEVVRRGIAQWLINQPGIAVTGQAANGLAAIHLLRKGVEADIVLTDLNMPVMDGITLAVNLSRNFPNIQVVVLTMNDKTAYINKALKAGVKGYVLKQGEMSDVLQAIHYAAAGRVCVIAHNAKIQL